MKHKKVDLIHLPKPLQIIGKLIPAGTGLARYRNIRVEPTEEAKAAVYAAYDEYDFTPFESQGSGEAVRLDEFEHRQ